MENYKQKYEAVLNRVKDYFEGKTKLYSNVDETLKYLFPELKESEDERIRKHLLKHFRNKTKEQWNGMPIKNIISWLEKQGKEKPDWSEEDEEMVQVAINACNSYQDSLVRNDSRFDKAVKAEEWLKSIKERMKGE